jgi:hypothetical protein
MAEKRASVDSIEMSSSPQRTQPAALLQALQERVFVAMVGHQPEAKYFNAQ